MKRFFFFVLIILSSEKKLRRFLHMVNSSCRIIVSWCTYNMKYEHLLNIYSRVWVRLSNTRYCVGISSTGIITFINIIMFCSNNSEHYVLIVFLVLTFLFACLFALVYLCIFSSRRKVSISKSLVAKRLMFKRGLKSIRVANRPVHEKSLGMN